MKRIALAIALASLATFPADEAAPRRTQDCPNVSVSCEDVVRKGESATFTALISGADPESKPTWKWTVSAGAILSGQDTPTIVVDTTGLPGNSTITATVKVTSFPEPCGSSASCTTGVMGIIIEDRIDEYGDIKFDDEKARLDNFAIELQNDPTAQGYIIAYGGRVGRRGEAMKRAGRAKGYLTDVRGISPQQVLTIDGGYQGDLRLVIKLRGRGAPPPEPSPTVDPKDVRFITSAPKPGIRRHRIKQRARSKARKPAGR